MLQKQFVEKLLSDNDMNWIYGYWDRIFQLQHSKLCKEKKILNISLSNNSLHTVIHYDARPPKNL